MTKSGLKKLVERASHLPGFWRGHDRRLELVVQALVAREFFHRDQQYIIEDDKLTIVDEFTGRPMPQRSWRGGMHQAIEAKEEVPITDPTETIARLSFQRFFKCFYKLSGMTGTAPQEAAGEFWRVYGLATGIHSLKCPLHPGSNGLTDFSGMNRANGRRLWPKSERVHATGRPLLHRHAQRAGVASERLGQWLTARGVGIQNSGNAARLGEEAGNPSPWPANEGGLPSLPTWLAAARTSNWGRGSQVWAAFMSSERNGMSRAGLTGNYLVAPPGRATREVHRHSSARRTSCSKSFCPSRSRECCGKLGSDSCPVGRRSPNRRSRSLKIKRSPWPRNSVATSSNPTIWLDEVRLSFAGVFDSI